MSQGALYILDVGSAMGMCALLTGRTQCCENGVEKVNRESSKSHA